MLPQRWLWGDELCWGVMLPQRLLWGDELCWSVMHGRSSLPLLEIEGDFLGEEFPTFTFLYLALNRMVLAAVGAGFSYE